MTVFHLPDLGEGLPDAEIREWYVIVGDKVEIDQPLVSMETAKAVVDVPAPFVGTIKKIYGEAGDVINTGAPLIEFEEKGISNAPKVSASHTVVGEIKEGNEVTIETAIVAPRKSNAIQAPKIKASPAVRVLAKKLNIALEDVTGTGPNSMITKADIQQAFSQEKALMIDGKPLRGVRRIMAQTMSESHAQVVPVTLVDDATITHWSEDEDVTLRIISAISKAVLQEPYLNAWFDGYKHTFKQNKKINLGLAMNSDDGLFVPVIKDIEKLLVSNPKLIRNHIENFKVGVKERSISLEDLKDATITLSNFGMFAGRYANAVIVLPQVSIIGAGKIREVVISKDQKIIISRALPLSLTFDHRAVTGAEATRFCVLLSMSWKIDRSRIS